MVRSNMQFYFLDLYFTREAKLENCGINNMKGFSKKWALSWIQLQYKGPNTLRHKSDKNKNAGNSSQFLKIVTEATKLISTPCA